MSDNNTPLFRAPIEDTPAGNYFNSLPLRTQLQELGKCRFMDPAEFEAGVSRWQAKIVIRLRAQGFNQGLNLRDSG